MNYKELLESAWYSGQLKKDHPLYPFEDKLLSVLSGFEGKRAKHDQEHRDMLDHWGVEFGDEVEFELSLLEGKHNRVWHMMLHFKYWEEKGMNPDILEQLKKDHPEVNLDEVSLPRVKGE